MRIRLPDSSLMNLSDSDNWALQVLPTEAPPEELLVDDESAFDAWVSSRTGDTALVLVHGEDTVSLFEGPWREVNMVTWTLLHRGWYDFGPQPEVEGEGESKAPDAPKGRDVRSHADRMYAGD